MRALLLLLSFMLSSPAAAQATETTLLDRFNSVDPKTTTEANCEAQTAQAEKLNAPDLLYGASVCYAANRPVEGNFLLNAGQVRSIADMVLMVPASKSDSDVVSSLYGFIYFYAGGPGKEEVLREPESRDRFFRLFDRWSPGYAPDYNPGWAVRRRPEAAAYQAAMGESKAARREQLTDVARLYSDDIYYSLHRRFQDVQARNQNSYVEGTPEAELSSDLMRQMDERSAALGIGVHPDNADRGDPSSARFPPAAPASDETALPDSADPVVQRCADIAERHTIAAESKVVRILITKSPEWGTIWRADMENPDQSIERFTCTHGATSYRPLELGDESMPPLPGGATPAATSN